MTHILSAAAAIATSAALLSAAGTARAQTPAAHYVAVPEAPAGKASVITRSTPWSLRGGAYVANRAPERDLVLCQLLARDVGRLQSFTSGGEALDADKLDKCNSRAKASPASGMAAR